MAVAYMFLLELQHIPGLRELDASAIAARFADDFEVPPKFDDVEVGGGEADGQGEANDERVIGGSTGSGSGDTNGDPPPTSPT